MCHRMPCSDPMQQSNAISQSSNPMQHLQVFACHLVARMPCNDPMQQSNVTIQRSDPMQQSDAAFQRSIYMSPRSPHVLTSFTVHRSPSTVRRSSFVVRRSSFVVHRSSFVVRRSSIPQTTILLVLTTSTEYLPILHRTMTVALRSATLRRHSLPVNSL